MTAPVSEQVIRIADRMYQCRRTLRALYAEKYDEIVGPYRKTIQHVARERHVDVIQAATQMAKEMQALFADPIITICLMAAAVDLSETSGRETML